MICFLRSNDMRAAPTQPETPQQLAFWLSLISRHTHTLHFTHLVQGLFLLGKHGCKLAVALPFLLLLLRLELFLTSLPLLQAQKAKGYGLRRGKGNMHTQNTNLQQKENKP